jgi:Domain of unknown function (DUF4397)
MKQSYSRIAAFTLCMAGILTACKKNTFQVTERTYPDGKALVKVGFFSATTVAPSVILRINGVNVSNPLTYPNAFPGGGFNMGGSLNADYMQVDPRTDTLKIYSNVIGTPNEIATLFQGTFTPVANEKQTLYVCDTGVNMTTILAPDKFNFPDSGQTFIRFINLMPNSLEVDFYRGTTLIATKVPYKSFTEYISMPPSPDSFFVRPTGTAPTQATIIARRQITTTNQRVYSILCRGYVGMTSGTRVPNISGIINQ